MSGSRDDGGPATFAELLDHYNGMAEEHSKAWDRNDADSRDANARRAMARAYRNAAEELERVMALVGKERTE